MNADPTSESEGAQQSSLIDEALKPLPQDRCWPIILCFLDGLKRNEAAKKLVGPCT